MLVGNFMVHRMTASKTPRPVTVDGEEMMADVHGLEVELTSVDSSNGSLIVRIFTAAGQEEASALCREGEIVTLTMGKAEQAPAKEA